MKKLCMILHLALIVCLLVGCQDKEAMAELEEFKAQTEVEEQNKAVVRRLLEEGINKGDYDFECKDPFVSSAGGFSSCSFFMPP